MNIVLGPGFDGGRLLICELILLLNTSEDMSAVVEMLENGSSLPKASENGSIPSKFVDEIVVEETFNFELLTLFAKTELLTFCPGGYFPAALFPLSTNVTLSLIVIVLLVAVNVSEIEEIVFSVESSCA